MLAASLGLLIAAVPTAITNFFGTLFSAWLQLAVKEKHQGYWERRHILNLRQVASKAKSIVVRPFLPSFTLVNLHYKGSMQCCQLHVITWLKQTFFFVSESAGSASVAFHLLSPGSRSYFSQAILQSAAATNPWAMVTKKEAKLRARRLAEVLDCPYENVSVLI